MVLVGANGTGKTSVLEALSLLSPGRGLRRARLADLLRTEANGRAASWGITVRLETPRGPSDIESRFVMEAPENASGRERRQTSVDGQAARGRASLAESLAMLWLTPEMDRLFADGRSARRRFLDRLVWGVDPVHVTRVAAYDRAMQQRSAVLRQDRPDATWLDALEETLAAHGIAVAAARRQTVSLLSQAAADIGHDFPPIRLAAEGTVENWLDDVPALVAEERLRIAFYQSRRLDRDSGGAAIGPHRSDLRVRHGRSDRPAAECSTGEQKMLLIALVLAGAQLLKRERGVAPLMLLDDVVAHLDLEHRLAVFDAVAALEAQTWYAGCDREIFRPLIARSQVVALSRAADGGRTVEGICGAEGIE